MRSVKSKLFVITFLLLVFLHHVSSRNPHLEKGLLFEDKTRLGSTPPSCYNKCNRCHPCMAVQVPTIPSHNRVRVHVEESELTQFLDPSANKYSNYKPLGWKCRCDNHFYNP